MIVLAPLLLAFAVAQAPGAAAPTLDAAPDGTPEDQALWRGLRAAANLTTVSMGRIAQCSFRIGYGRYYEQLDAVLKEGAEAERPEAKALRDAVAREAKAADEALPARPGLRECQYVLRDLGLQMPLLSEPTVKKTIRETRAKARACAKKLAPLGEKLSARADALEGALAAVDAYLVRRSAAAAAAAPVTGEAKDPAAALAPAAKDAATSPAAAPATPPAAEERP